MLPVLIYEPDRAIRAVLLDSLKSLSKRTEAKISVSLSTESLESMRGAIRQESGILLSILGVPGGQSRKCTELGDLVMRQNHNSYTVFFLHDPADLGELAANCMRPAGILAAPLSADALRRVLDRIVDDFQQLTDQSGSDDCMIAEANGTTYRIPYDRILYLEALNKMLTIHTERQTVTVRRSLSALEETLPPQFVRCHRAYLVNQRCITHIAFSDMSLTVTNGDILPISRSQKGVLKQSLDPKEGMLL